MRAPLLAAAVFVIAGIAATQLRSDSRVTADDVIVVDLRGDLDTTLAPRNLTALRGLEQRLGRLAGVQKVVGPASFVGAAAARVNAVAGAQAQALGLRYGYSGVPSLTNQGFVLQLVKGTSLTPKKRFARLFPSDRLARVLVHPRTSLDGAQARALRERVSQLVAETRLAGVRVTA